MLLKTSEQNTAEIQKFNPFKNTDDIQIPSQQHQTWIKKDPKVLVKNRSCPTFKIDIDKKEKTLKRSSSDDQLKIRIKKDPRQHNTNEREKSERTVNIITGAQEVSS